MTVLICAIHSNTKQTEAQIPRATKPIPAAKEVARSSIVKLTSLAIYVSHGKQTKPIPSRFIITGLSIKIDKLAQGLVAELNFAIDIGAMR